MDQGKQKVAKVSESGPFSMLKLNREVLPAPTRLLVPYFDFSGCLPESLAHPLCQQSSCQLHMCSVYIIPDFSSCKSSLSSQDCQMPSSHLK